MKMLPVGIEDFADIRMGNYYYVDKTAMIAELLDHLPKVTLFTRPRRFGKTLTMSMLRHFFEVGAEPELFKGLAIEKYPNLCEKWQGQYPVISISLKNVSGLDFVTAVQEFKAVVAGEARRISARLDETKLPEELREMLACLRNPKKMDDFDLRSSLRTLSEILYWYYDRKVIVLIDEYDVPLDKASRSGYYEQMVDLIRSFLNAIKTNEYLAFGVLTGCLRVSRESIFTGLNNLRVRSITSARFDSAFGFTAEEVRELIDYYGLSSHADTIKKWYDGYLFGGKRVYCPWSVLNYCDEWLGSKQGVPESFWINSSGNDIVRKLVHQYGGQIREELSDLISGGSIQKNINQELTYKELDQSVENVWSVLFMTGYLTSGREGNGSYCDLVIPNEEVREIFVKQIREWSLNPLRGDSRRLAVLADALCGGNARKLEEWLNDFLQSVISIRDIATKEKKENYYHGLLLGMLGLVSGLRVRSNWESGDGYADLVALTDEVGVVIEVKYGLENARTALTQIDEKRYAASLAACGRVIRCGIAFEGKRCRVAME